MSTQVAKRERPASQWTRNPIGTLRDEMHDFFSRTFDGEHEFWPLARISPSLDLSETDNSVEVRMDLPGVEAKEIDIQVSGNNLLTVSGERKEEQEEKEKTWHRVERRYGSFSRSVMLPCAINESAVEAKYREGVLTITLPKTDEAKAHKITVKT